MKKNENFSAVLFASVVWLTLLYLFVTSVEKTSFDESAINLMDNMRKTKELIDGHP